MPISPTFELFDERPCAARLPVNPITDDFDFIRFLPLVDSTNGAPMAVPFDVVNPTAAALIRASFPDVPLTRLRGGISLNPDWSKVIEPRVERGKTPVSETVTVPSVNNFLSSPQLKVGGKTITAVLSAENVRALRDTGSTLIPVPEEGAMRLVRVTAARPKLTAPKRVVISDLNSFVSQPTIQLETGEIFAVTLTPANIEELRSFGISRVAITEASSVYVLVANTAPSLAPENAPSSALAITTPAPSGPLSPFGPLPSVPFPSLALALYVPYRQTWQLLGYARGAVLNSISLAPQEETTIEIYTWDRRKRTLEKSLSTESEQSLETTVTNRDTVETVHEAAQDSGWGVNGKIGVTIPSSPVDFGVGGDIKQNLKDANKSTHQVMAEAVQKASAKLKATRQTKVEESEEFGSEQRVTRKLKNPNMCRTLNLDCYEVVAGYSVSTVLRRDQIRLCLLVPHLIPGAVDRGFLLCHEGVLRSVLRDPTYVGGFDASHTLAAADRLCNFKCKAACDCRGGYAGTNSQPHPAPPPVPVGVPSTTVDRGTGIFTVVGAVGALEHRPTPAPPPASAPGGDPTGRVATAATDLRTRILTLDGATPDLFCDQLTDPNPFNPVTAEARAAFGQWFFWQTTKEFYSGNWNTLRNFMMANRTDPDGLDAVLSSVDFDHVQASDPLFSLAETLKNIFTQLLLSHPAAEAILIFQPILMPPPNDNGLRGALDNARSAMAAYRAATSPGSPPASTTGTGTSNGSAPTQAAEYSAKDLAEASVAEEQLLCHVRENQSYYRNEIWRRLDAEDQARALSLLGNLEALIEKQVLGFVGDSAAMPIMIGRFKGFADWYDVNVTKNELIDPDPPPVQIVLPTPSVTLEARLGQCDACEDFIMQHRDLDLQQKKAEVATAEAHADQQASEAERYKQRLAKMPPNLDAPTTCCDGQTTLRVMLDKPPTP